MFKQLKMKFLTKVLMTAACCLGRFSTTSGRSASIEEEEFITNLTKGYNPEVRPVYYRSEKTQIGFSVGLNSIINLDEKQEIFSSSTWMLLQWTDQFLTWNLSRYPYNMITMTAKDVWTPTLSLRNSLTGMKLLDTDGLPVAIHYSGFVFLSYAERFDTICKVNIKQFPFDQQICQIQISPYYPDITGEYPVIVNSTLILDSFEENGEWIIKASRVELHNVAVLGTVNEAVFAIVTLERRTAFYIMNTILPLVFLSFLNPFAFLLPIHCGENMSVSVSILLSYAVFLNLISSYLPENSDNLCFYIVYLTMLVLISTLICLTVLFILAIHSRLEEGRNIPKWLTMKSTVTPGETSDTDGSDTSTPGKGGPAGHASDDIITNMNLTAFVFFFSLTVLTTLIYFIGVLCEAP